MEKYLIDTNIFLENILFKKNKHLLFNRFIKDILPTVKVDSLSKEKYLFVEDIAIKFHLDFNDAYQVCVAEEHNYSIVTLDKDFERANKHIKVNFLK